MAELRERVREALASEMARVVAEAVREVITAVLRGGPMPYGRGPTPARPVTADRWDDPDPWDESDPYGRVEPVHHHIEDDTPAPTGAATRSMAVAPAAVASGVSAGRWWLRRRGSAVEAIGVGVLVALAVLSGGPVVRMSATVAAAAADLAAVTEALDSSAGRLEPI
jgi:hypothetical protein